MKALSPADDRFFDLQDFNPTQHRLSPIGLFDDVRINIILFLHPQPSLAFMYTRGMDRSFFPVDNDIPSTIQFKTPAGSWESFTFPPDIYSNVRIACVRGLKRMTGE